MRWIKALCLLITALITGVLSLCWRTLVFLIDLIDGELIPAIEDDDIERKLTEDEIREFETKKAIPK